MAEIDTHPASQKTRDLVATGYRYYVPCYKPRHMILERGQGSRVFDIEGRDYIDLGAGIGVNVLGHGHPDLVGALTTQAARLWHTSNIYFTEPAVNLAESLVAHSPFAARVFFCNSGAEANEAAIKLVRKWAAQRGRSPQEREIVTFQGSFHGRSLATVTATAQPKYKQGFEPLPGGFAHCSAFNDPEALAKVMSSKTAAVMLEPVQGEGGVIPAAPGFLKFVRQICDRHDALLVLDEVQCGMGRTGKLWCHMWEEGVQPDILTSAKALGGGFPIGALLAGAKVAEVLQFGDHGSTFGGNPMACAAALTVLKHVCDPALMAHVLERGAQLCDALATIRSNYGIFREVRGRGLMVGAELGPASRGRSADLMDAARRHGALILQAGPDVLRFLPPLNITAEELQEGLRRLETAIAEFMGST
jgi:acetylornithine/N-succinyldiaminopimelate aminotransferase